MILMSLAKNQTNRQYKPKIWSFISSDFSSSCSSVATIPFIVGVVLISLSIFKYFSCMIFFVRCMRLVNIMNKLLIVKIMSERFLYDLGFVKIKINFLKWYKWIKLPFWVQAKTQYHWLHNLNQLGTLIWWMIFIFTVISFILAFLE